MNLIKKLYFQSTYLIPHSFLQKGSGINVLLPYQHVVSDEYLPHIKALYAYKNKAQFEKDLEWLLKNYTPIHPEELANKMANNLHLPGNTFLLTFDDGFKEVYDIISPILKSKGVPALFFLNTAFVDNKELFYRCKLSLVIEKLKTPGSKNLTRKVADFLGTKATDPYSLRNKILRINYLNKHQADLLGQLVEIDFTDYLHTHQPFLQAEQIRQLESQGFMFGGHSIDHPHYKWIDLNEQIRQTNSSIEYTRQFQHSPHRFFSFPHEDKEVKQAFFSSLNKASAFPVNIFGVQNQKEEIHNHVLHRFNIENPALDIKPLTKGILLYNTLLKLVGKRRVERS